jgi:hypothetical protein
MPSSAKLREPSPIASRQRRSRARLVMMTPDAKSSREFAWNVSGQRGTGLVSKPLTISFEAGGGQ